MNDIPVVYIGDRAKCDENDNKIFNVSGSIGIINNVRLHEACESVELVAIEFEFKPDREVNIVNTTGDCRDGQTGIVVYEQGVKRAIIIFNSYPYYWGIWSAMVSEFEAYITICV